MNQVTQYILGIYQINMIIRDTVSYVAPRKEQSFSKEIYEHRGRSLELLTAEGSPFAHFVSINKEKADKLVENINEFKKEMYSPESRVFRVVGEGIEVDDKMHHRVYEMAIGIYQTLLDVLGGYIKYAKDNDQLELRIEELVAADEYFFRSLSYFALINDIFKLFKEFSDAMQQHKGEPNPIAKFINEDINKMVQLIAFMNKHNRVTNLTYKKMTDLTNAFIEHMGGQRQLPEGKNFPELFTELNEFALKTLQDAETNWRTIFLPVAKAHQEEMKKNERKNKEELS